MTSVFSRCESNPAVGTQVSKAIELSTQNRTTFRETGTCAPLPTTNGETPAPITPPRSRTEPHHYGVAIALTSPADELAARQSDG